MKTKMNNTRLATAFVDLEPDVRQLRRLVSLALGHFLNLPGSGGGHGEEVAALLEAAREKAEDIEKGWDRSWEAAGGRS